MPAFPIVGRNNNQWAMQLRDFFRPYYDLDTGLAYYDLDTGLGTKIITKTYAELLAMATGTAPYSQPSLVPGQKYRFLHGAEYLIVTALTASTLKLEASSESYPQDIIHYKLATDYIKFRHDTIRNISMWEDWRTTTNVRWRDSEGYYTFSEDPGVVALDVVKPILNMSTWGVNIPIYSNPPLMGMTVNIVGDTTPGNNGPRIVQDVSLYPGNYFTVTFTVGGLTASGGSPTLEYTLPASLTIPTLDETGGRIGAHDIVVGTGFDTGANHVFAALYSINLPNTIAIKDNCWDLTIMDDSQVIDIAASNGSTVILPGAYYINLGYCVDSTRIGWNGRDITHGHNSTLKVGHDCSNISVGNKCDIYSIADGLSWITIDSNCYSARVFPLTLSDFTNPYPITKSGTHITDNDSISDMDPTSSLIYTEPDMAAAATTFEGVPNQDISYLYNVTLIDGPYTISKLLNFNTNHPVTFIAEAGYTFEFVCTTLANINVNGQILGNGSIFINGNTQDSVTFKLVSITNGNGTFSVLKEVGRSIYG